MEEGEEQPRADFEGAKLATEAISGHETRPNESRQESKELFASDSFCNRMCGMMSKSDIEKLTAIQLDTLSRFEATNAKLSQLNRHSYIQYEKLNIHFLHHTRMLIDMKKDLDVIFRRIRNLKSKLTKQYGYAFTVTSANIQKLEEEVCDSEDYKEEKPQKVQEASCGNNMATLEGASNANESADQLQNPKSSVPMYAAGSHDYDSKGEKGTVEKLFSQDENKKVVLRPQLSSSDDNYNCEESDGDTSEESEQNTSNDNTAEAPNLGEGGEHPEINKVKNLELASKDSKECQEHRTLLQLEISSSDESLEDIDDESEDFDTNAAEKYSSTSPKEDLTNNQNLNTKDLNNDDCHKR